MKHLQDTINTCKQREEYLIDYVNGYMPSHNPHYPVPAKLIDMDTWNGATFVWYEDPDSKLHIVACYGIEEEKFEAMQRAYDTYY